jgi:glycosyltransferase involved in cell wall biosynthesis
MEELVKHGCTGLHFDPGDPEDLAAKAEWAWSHPAEVDLMGREARNEYAAKYTSERNYDMLMAIYHQTIARSSPSYSPAHCGATVSPEEPDLHTSSV